MTIEEFVSMQPGSPVKVIDEVFSPAAHIGIPGGTMVDFKYVLSQENEGMVVVQVHGLPILLGLRPKFLEMPQ